MSYGQQGGPVWSPGGPPTPNWGALAADAERRRLRKRWWTIGGSVLAATAIGTLVAFAIVSESDDGGGEAPTTTLPSASLSPSTRDTPTFDSAEVPQPPRAADYLSDPEKDTAPFTLDSFFTSPMRIEGRAYSQAATGHNNNCAGGVTPELAEVLQTHGCLKLLRATYTGGDRFAMTIGVAQFPSKQAAEAADEAYVHSLRPLTSGNAPEFCGDGGCLGWSSQVGRYVYLTVAGSADGTPLSDGTPRYTRATNAGLDGDEHAFNLILRRAEAQASAEADRLISERENDT